MSNTVGALPKRGQRRARGAAVSVEQCRQCARVGFVAVGQNICDACARLQPPPTTIEEPVAPPQNTNARRQRRRAEMQPPAAPAARNGRQRRRHRAIPVIDLEQPAPQPIAPLFAPHRPSRADAIDLLQVYAAHSILRMAEARLLNTDARIARVAFFMDDVAVIERVLQQSFEEADIHTNDAAKKEAVREACKTQLVETPISENLVGDSCTVCLGTFEAGENVTALDCNHTFHKPCISTWIATKNVCPVCRRQCIKM